MYSASKRKYFEDKTIYALAESMLLTRILFYSVLFNAFEKVGQTYCFKLSGCSVHPPEPGPLCCGRERTLFPRVARAASRRVWGLPAKELLGIRSGPGPSCFSITPALPWVIGAGASSPATHSPSELVVREGELTASNYPGALVMTLCPLQFPWDTVPLLPPSPELRATRLAS